MKTDRPFARLARAAALAALVCIFAGFVAAELPAPAVRYIADPPRMELTFYTTEPFPPVGFAFWAVDVERDGIGATYFDANPSRTARFALAEPLAPGTYYIKARIYDDDGAVLDESPVTEWTYTGPLYGGTLPRIAIGGGWETSFAVANHASGNPVAVTIDVYNEAGEIVAKYENVLQPRQSWSLYIEQPGAGRGAAQDEIFAGSAAITADAPLGFVYRFAGPGRDGEKETYSTAATLTPIN